MKKTYLYSLFVLTIVFFGGILPGQAAAADITYTCSPSDTSQCYTTKSGMNVNTIDHVCQTNCDVNYTSHTGTVTIIPQCGANSPASFTARLIVNGVSTPVHTQTCVPAAPASITPTCPAAIGDPTVLQWPASVGATDYAFRLDYPSDPAPHLVQIDSGLAARTYSSTTLPLATQYTAWVHGCNSGGCSPAVAQVTFTCPVPAPAATISATTCDIQSGDSTCQGDVTWNIQNATSPNVEFNGTPYSSNSTGTNEPLTLNRGANEVYALNGTDILGSVTALADCDATAPYWRDTYCDSTPPPPAPTITLSLDKELIRSGGTATLTLDLTAPYPTRCTVSGAEGAPVTRTYAAGTITDTYTTRPLTSAQVISVSCEPNPAIAGTPAATDEARVEVVPTIQEI